MLRYLGGLEGVDLDAAAKSDGVTPLLAASFYGRADVVDFLLGAGANVNNKMKTLGSSPLIMAAQQGHVQIVGKLADKGSDLFSNNYR
jgi:ankyrin repeat protein